MSHSGDIPITIWWQQLLKTKWVILVTFPLLVKSGDSDHCKRNESFWWHSHYNLVAEAIENEISHSGDIPITIWWQRPMRNGMSHSGDIPITMWWHKPFGKEWSTYDDIPITIWWHKPSKNEMSCSGDISIRIWWYKPLETKCVILVTFPLQSGDKSHWKRNKPFWWHSHYNLVTSC